MAGIYKRFRDLTVKYGRVALGVHLSVSALSVSACYIAIKNSVDVEGALEYVGLVSAERSKEASQIQLEMNHGSQEGVLQVEGEQREAAKGNNGFFSSMVDVDKIKKLATGGGGALALALLCNKVLIPVRIPITLALTPRVHRYLKSRGFRV